MSKIKAISEAIKAKSAQKTATSYSEIIKKVSDNEALAEYKPLCDFNESVPNIHTDPLSLSGVEKQILNFNW